VLKKYFSLWLGVMLLPNFVFAQTNFDEALWEATRKGEIETVKALLAKGADVNAKTRYGATALFFAADRGNVDLLKTLLEHGAEINAKDTFYSATPLSWAAYNNRVEAVKLLIAKGAEGADDVLMIGVSEKNLDLVKAALENAKLKPETLSSALANAKNSGSAEIVAALEQAGAMLPPEPAYKIDPQKLARYPGRYGNKSLGMEIAFTIKDGKLVATTAGRPPLTFVATDETNFTAIEFQGIAITFNVEGGQAKSFTQQLGQSQYVFDRVVAEEAKSAEAVVTNKPIAEPEPVVTAPSKKKMANGIVTKHWPSFRGLNASGVAQSFNAPLHWNAEKSENIKWKTAVPGLSHASPIVWEDRVFITTAIGSDTSSKLRVGLYGDVAPDNDVSKHTWEISCLDKKSGKILWERVAYEGAPKVKRHTKATQANSTPATDGKYVVALFGAEGMYCYDMNGKLVWKKDLGNLDSGWFYDPDYQWGHGSSPVIYKNLVIVQCDIQKNSFIAAYSLKDGEQVWLTSRDEIPSWGTPTIHESNGRAQMITNGTKHIRSYDPRTGKELWRLAGNSEIAVPTPIIAHDLIYVTSGYRPIQPIYAIRLEALGDISLQDTATTNAHVAWSKKRGGPYMPTPIVYEDYLYTCANNGAVTCYNAKTGAQMYRERLGGQGSAYAFTASPIAADDKIYFTSEDGEIFVVQAGPKYELLATNTMGEVCMATPAFSENMLIIRTQQHVFGIGN